MDWFKNLSLKQKIIIVSIGGILLIYIFINSVIMPKVNRIRQIKKEIVKETSVLEEIKRKEMELKILEKEYDLLERELVLVEERLPQEKEIATALRKISEIATLSQIDFFSFQPMPTIETKELYLEIPINIELEGTYHALKTFLDNLANLERIINVVNISIKGLEFPKEEKAKKENTIEINMLIKMFMYKGPENV